eukprot:gene3413-8287_t
METVLPSWTCPDIDDLLLQIVEHHPEEISKWVMEVLLPYRQALKTGSGTKVLTMNTIDKLLISFFMHLGIPNYHNMTFLVMLSPQAHCNKSCSETKMCLSLVQRAALLLCGARDVKQKTLKGSLPEEVIAGYPQNMEPITRFWTHRRKIQAGSREKISEKAVSAICPQNLVVAISCFGHLFQLVINTEDSSEDVKGKLLNIILNSTLDEKINDSQKGFCQMTYAPRSLFMDAIQADDRWLIAWDSVQDADFALALFPSINPSIQFPDDPTQGTMQLLRKAEIGGVVGDKHCLSIFQDGSACFSMDHVLLDGAPAIFLASQIVQHADKYNILCNKSTSTVESLASSLSSSNMKTHTNVTPSERHTGSMLHIPNSKKVSEIEIPKPPWSNVVERCINQGSELCAGLSEICRDSRHMILNSFGRGNASKLGLSIDGIFQAAVQLALSNLGMDEVLFTKEVLSVRHFDGGRVSNFMVNSTAMDAFVKAAQTWQMQFHPDCSRIASPKQRETSDANFLFDSSPHDFSKTENNDHLLQYASILLRAAVIHHKERIKVHKRHPMPDLNMLMAIGEMLISPSEDAFDLSDRSVALFMDVKKRATSLGSRGFMFETSVVSNATNYYGVAVFGTASPCLLNFGYIIRDEHIEVDIVSNHADVPVPLHNHEPILDVTVRLMRESFETVRQILGVL